VGGGAAAATDGDNLDALCPQCRLVGSELVLAFTCPQCDDRVMFDHEDRIWDRVLLPGREQLLLDGQNLAIPGQAAVPDYQLT